MAPASVYRSAMPWNCIAAVVIPVPGAAEASTRMYASASAAFASLRPSRPASCLSGRIAIRLPPPLTQLVSIETWLPVSPVCPSSTTSKPPSSPGDSRDTSSVVKAFSPSFSRISVR